MSVSLRQQSLTLLLPIQLCLVPGAANPNPHQKRERERITERQREKRQRERKDPTINAATTVASDNRRKHRPRHNERRQRGEREKKKKKKRVTDTKRHDPSHVILLASDKNHYTSLSLSLSEAWHQYWMHQILQKRSSSRGQASDIAEEKKEEKEL